MKHSSLSFSREGVWIILLILLLSGCSLSPQGERDTLSVASYNVQNLFDTEVSGTEYPEYTASGGWSGEAYRIRVERVERVLRFLDSDICILQEVESEKVVRDLVSGRLCRNGWRWWAQVKEPGMAAGIGVISRIEPSAVRVHRVSGSRPVLELDFGSLVVLGVHACSKRSGGDELRVEAARVIRAVAAEHPDSLVVAIGDFNENPTEGRTARKQTMTVEPGFSMSACWILDGSVPVTGERSLLGRQMWYDPFLDPERRARWSGTCCWNSRWYRYDRALLTGGAFDLSGWDFSSFEVSPAGFLLDGGGMPLAWDRRLLSGYSDHLPVVLTLKRY